MKHTFILFLVIVFTSTLLLAQDEGRLIKVDRLDKNMGVYIGLGPSFTLGENVGDYSSGFNLEAGFLKRSNRVLSWGGSATLIAFPYDPNVTEFNYFEVRGSSNPVEAYSYEFEGGDVFLTSIAFTLKLNFVPVRDDSKISVYGFVKPFVTLATRSEITAYETYGYNYGNPNNADDWNIDPVVLEYGSEEYDPFAFSAEFSGGIFIGPGIEFNPAKRVTFFAQASFGYTFPIGFISLSSFEPYTESIVDPDGSWPIVKKGFPSVNIQLGVSFNF